MTLAFDAPRIQEVVGSLSRKMLINGEWVDAASGKTFDSINPATEEVIASVAHGDAEDAYRAVRAARAAFDDGSGWRTMPHGKRGRIIHKLGDLILDHLEEFALLESLDNGKPYAVAKAADVPLTADMFHYTSGWATKIEGNTMPVSGREDPEAASGAGEHERHHPPVLGRCRRAVQPGDDPRQVEVLKVLQTATELGEDLDSADGVQVAGRLDRRGGRFRVVGSDEADDRKRDRPGPIRRRERADAIRDATRTPFRRPGANQGPGRISRPTLRLLRPHDLPRREARSRPELARHRGRMQPTRDLATATRWIRRLIVERGPRPDSDDHAAAR